MREIRTSGLMSGDGKRATASRSRTAPILDSTPVQFAAVDVEFTVAGRPSGGTHLAAPGGPVRAEFGEEGGLFAAAVTGFAEVVGEVVEAGELAAAFDEFPGAAADGAGWAGAPEGGAGRGFGAGAEQGEEVDAVERGDGEVGGGEEGGGEVARDDGFAVDGAGGETAGPAQEEGDADAPFKTTCFFAVQGGVGAGASDDGAAVVAEEDERGITFEAQVAQLRGDLADGVVEGDGHGSEEAMFFVDVGGDAVEVLIEGMEGGVDGVGGQVKEQGAGAVVFDEAEEASAAKASVR
jgi:hypothetical protein